MFSWLLWYTCVYHPLPSCGANTWRKEQVLPDDHPFFPLDMPMARCTHLRQCLLADKAGRAPACLHLPLSAVPTPIPFVSTKCGVCGSWTINAGISWLYRLFYTLLSCLEGRIRSPRVNLNVIAARSKKNSGVCTKYSAFFVCTDGRWLLAVPRTPTECRHCALFLTWVVWMEVIGNGVKIPLEVTKVRATCCYG